jgi:hypothetical protein
MSIYAVLTLAKLDRCPVLPDGARFGQFCSDLSPARRETGGLWPEIWSVLPFC